MARSVSQIPIPSINYRKIGRSVASGLGVMFEDRITSVAIVVFLSMILLAAVGPALAPYSYADSDFDERLQPPSSEHLLGTTDRGEDVLSRLLYGSRPTMIAGLVGGFLIISIGASIGVTAGYMGGKVESALMRFTDFIYGVPLIPFAIVLITFLGVGFWPSIVVIGLILWRGNARVLRSQVLQIKERPYIKSSRAIGASNSRIVVKHVLPNIAGMMILFYALGIGSAIIYQANLAFLGVANPFQPSWGIIVRNAYDSASLMSAWWWSLPAGILISMTVLSTFLIGRGYERVSQTSAGDIQ